MENRTQYRRPGSRKGGRAGARRACYKSQRVGRAHYAFELSSKNRRTHKARGQAAVNAIGAGRAAGRAVSNSIAAFRSVRNGRRVAVWRPVAVQLDFFTVGQA